MVDVVIAFLFGVIVGGFLTSMLIALCIMSEILDGDNHGQEWRQNTGEKTTGCSDVHTRTDGTAR